MNGLQRGFAPMNKANGPARLAHLSTPAAHRHVGAVRSSDALLHSHLGTESELGQRLFLCGHGTSFRIAGIFRPSTCVRKFYKELATTANPINKSWQQQAKQKKLGIGRQRYGSSPLSDGLFCKLRRLRRNRFDGTRLGVQDVENPIQSRDGENRPKM